MSFASRYAVVAWLAMLSSQCLAAKVTTIAVPAGGKPMAAKSDSTGKIHLVFDSAAGPQYCQLPAGGKSLGKAIPLVDQKSSKPGLEFSVWDLAVGADGSVHVVLGTNAWKLKLPKEEWGYMYARLPARSNSFDPIRNLNRKPSEGFSIAVSDKGQVAAIWMADRLYANISEDNGKTFGQTVALDASLNPCNCCTTSTVYAAEDRLAILYREETNNDRDMFLAFWEPSSNKATKTRVSTTPWKIDSCPMTYYSMTRTEEGFEIAWPTKGEIFFARLDESGQLRNPQEIKTSGSNGMRTGLIVLATPDHQSTVVWKKDNRLGWQSYDAKGNAVGLPGLVPSEGNGVAGAVAQDGTVVLFR